MQILHLVVSRINNYILGELVIVNFCVHVAKVICILDNEIKVFLKFIVLSN